jgi:hypothetical protein
LERQAIKSRPNYKPAARCGGRARTRGGPGFVADIRAERAGTWK